MDIYITDATRTFEHSRVAFHPSPATPENGLVKVYPSLTGQTVVGFGAALTEASGVVFSRLSPEAREQFVELCFGVHGNRYSLARTTIQSCDFALTPRAYVANPADEALETFSVDDDWAYVLPLVKAAQEKNPALEFVASPWSPPAWAKTNFTMKYGGKLRRRFYPAWARMIARYLVAYRAYGVNIHRITVQNEPEATQVWESCRYNADDERLFVRDYLKPALLEAGLDDVKVLIWDHNKQRMLDRILAVSADAEAWADVDGVAFHWYAGDHFEAVRAARALVGERELIFSEGCDAYSAGDPDEEIPHAEHYAREVIGDLENGANGILDWNILLDAQGGPTHVGNWCDAPIMLDGETGRLRVRRPFYYLGHFSRYIRPGAHRMVATRFTTDLETTAFQNPDGSRVAVVLNRTGSDRDFTLATEGSPLERRQASLTSPAHSIMTLVWNNGLVG